MSYDLPVGTIVSLAVTLFVAIGSWAVTNLLASRRDRKNKKRDLQTKYLIEAYRNIESACSRKEVMPYRDGIEKALGDIQLFGSREQVRLVKQIMADIETGSYTDPRALLDNLRQGLRKELELEPLEEKILHFRITGEVLPKNRRSMEP